LEAKAIGGTRIDTGHNREAKCTMEPIGDYHCDPSCF